MGFPDIQGFLIGKLFGNVLSDFDLLILAFKIVVLLFIVGFVKNRFGGGPVTIIITLVLAYIFLFQHFEIFGPMMFIYLFIIFGFTQVLFDLSIVKPWRKEPSMEGIEKEDMMMKTRVRMR
ncbi:MAG: hypothetical protein QW735_00810 [archaeon]